MTGLYDVNEWIVLLVLVAALLAAAEIGYRVGIRHTARTGGSTAYLTHEVSALGVLALILGFTFSMAAGKFEVRRALILDEANAIGTAALRGELLPPPYAAQAGELFRQYAKARVALFEANTKPGPRNAALAESERLQRELWTLAGKVLDLNRLDLGSGLFIEALNDMIDMHGKRKAAQDAHLPAAVFYLIYAVALFAFLLSGIAAGVHASRSRASTFVMVLLVSAVILFVVDLDRPQRGLLRIDDASMTDLLRSMGSQAPTR